ncbi:MAG: lipoyl(octanoyl) transferase LipB [Verrucomicrobiota bacterium]
MCPSLPTNASTDLRVIDWGRTSYAQALEAQRALVDQRKSRTASDSLIFTEHEPVFTIGLRKGAADHLIWDAQELAERGIDFFESNRGGDITYHGPGQIVAYPIVSLEHRKDLHAYLRDLEEVVIRTLASFSLEASRREGKTGIWLGERKICAIGVAVKSWVTYHGFALNVDPDMSHFQGIVPCGITDGTVTSMRAELGEAVAPEAVKARLAVEFRTLFANTLSEYGKT